MPENYGRPTTVTTPTGEIITRRHTAQGDVVNINGIDQVLVGYQKDGFGTGVDAGIKVSQVGIPVLTATNDQLVMSSEFDLFKIVSTGVFSFVPADFLNSGNTYLTKLATYIINYNSVVSPTVFVFIENALTERILLPYYSFNFDTGVLNYQAIANIGDTQTTVEIRSIAPLSPGVSFRYYIVQETSSAS